MKSIYLFFIFSVLFLVSVASAQDIIFNPPGKFIVINQTYIDKNLVWTFTKIDDKTWMASFKVNDVFLSDTSKMAGNDLCSKYFSTDMNCSDDKSKTKLSTDVSNFTNYPLKALTPKIGFTDYKYDKGSGSFYIVSPLGFIVGDTIDAGFGSTIMTYSASQEICGNLNGYDNVTVLANTTLTICKLNSTAGTGFWNVSATNINVYGTINGNYKVIGGAGANGGSIYGTSNYFDIDTGSGGGSASSSYSEGGGIIILNATSTLFINGTVSANGEGGHSDGYGTGGGSGGGIWINGNSVNINSATITTNGGGGGSSTGGSTNGGSYGGIGGAVDGWWGGGGGGGRIKIFYGSLSNTSSTVTTTGGSAGGSGGAGAVGTILYQQEPFIEIKTYGEQTYNPLTFNLTFSSSSESQTFYNQNTSRQLISSLPQGDVTVQVSSYGYQTRKYYYNFNAFSSNIFLNSYLLATANGIVQTFHVSDSYGTPLSGVLITAQKLVNSTWMTVAQQKTTIGVGSDFFLDPSVTYQISFSLTGYNTYSTNFQPSLTQSSFDIALTSTTGGNVLPYVWNDVGSSVVYNYTSGNIILTYTDNAGYLNNITLQINSVSALANTPVCTITNTTIPSGTILCYVGNITGGGVYAYMVTGGFDSRTGSLYYILGSGNFDYGKYNSKLFGDCSSLSNLTNCREGMIMTVFLVLTCIFIGVWSPTSAIILMLVGIGVSLASGLIVISLSAFVGLILVSAIIIWRVRQ